MNYSAGKTLPDYLKNSTNSNKTYFASKEHQNAKQP